MVDAQKTEDLQLEARNFLGYLKKDIGKDIRSGKSVIYISFSELASFSPSLSELLISSPEQALQILEVALEESGLVQKPRVRLKEVPDSLTEKIRNLRAKHLNKLVQVEGIIRLASEVRPQVVNARFECPSCGTIISVLQTESRFREPSRCSCGRRGQFKLISKEMVDAQRLVIEESPENLSGGEQPRRISVFLREDLVEPKMEEKTTPGARIQVIGVLNEIAKHSATGTQLVRYDIAIEANNIIPLEETYEDFDISEEDERQIQELAADPKAFNKLSDSIAPSIYGYEEIKQAILLQMFSGVKKTKSDGNKTRGDIHILLVGDPGVAKSQILKFVSTIAPKGRYVVGKSTSGAGLTATVVRDEYLRGWSLEAGAMVLSNHGLICIDELEKMDPNDRSAMHEALEQQCYLPDFQISLADNSKLKIGEFVEKLIERNKQEIQKGTNCEILQLKEDIKILTTDFESIYPVKIDKVSRHVAPDKFIKISLANGRSITVTPEHPCWTIENGKITTVPAKEITTKKLFPTVAFGKIRWSKIKSVEVTDNKDINYVYDIMINSTHAFISNNMVLHNSVTISKANIQASLRAETTVLAAGNPKFGRFDPYQTVASQIDIPPTLINRFDVVFIMKDIPDRAKDEAIATHVLMENTENRIAPIIDRELFRKYIAYAKQKIIPKLTEPAIEEIKKFYVDLRNAQISGEVQTRPLPISARQLDALIRMSEASAKSRLSQQVSRDDAKRGINLMKYYLMQVGYDYETKTFDIDRIATGVSTSQRGKIMLVKDTLNKLESRLGKLIPIEEVRKELEGKIDEKDLEDALDKLTISGDIFHPRKGFIQRM